MSRRRKDERPGEVLPTEQLQTMQWITRYLQVSRPRVFQLMKNEGLPHVKFDRTLRFDPVAVARWVAEKQSS